MKKRILTIMCVSVLAVSTLVGCGNKVENVNTVDNAVGVIAETAAEAAETAKDAAEAIETEAPHEHSFTETITKEATCLEAGEKTLVCDCGESSVEEVPATGHDFSNYVSNEDATYTADGTETATCTCGETDTRVAEGSMLTYTFEDMDATKYAKSTVNVRSLPNTDGEKLGGLSTNDEVKVTGKCAETGWYRIEYSDGIAYVSDEYLVDEKVETPKPEVSNASTVNSFSYELHTIYTDEKGRKFYYLIKDETFWDYPQSVWEEANAYNTNNNLVGYFYYTKWKTADGRTIAKYAPSNLGCPEHE